MFSLISSLHEREIIALIKKAKTSLLSDVSDHLAKIIKKIREEIPEKKRISYGRYNIIKSLGFIMYPLLDTIADFSSRMFELRDNDPFVRSLGIQLLSLYGEKTGDLDLVLPMFEKAAMDNDWIVSFSFSSADDALSELLEPGVPAPSKRLETIKRIKQTSICCGMYLMPVVPLITDTQEMIETAVVKAKEAGVDFIIFGGMTLKPGRKKEYFMRFLGERFPELVARYGQIYPDDNAWGAPDARYVDKGNKLFDDIATRHAIAKRIPSKIFENIVSTNELIIVVLEQLDYLATLRGKNSPYGYAAYSLSQIKQPIETMNGEALLGIKGVGRFTAKLIQEIIETKRCGYYEELL
jgi:hypothetical protein